MNTPTLETKRLILRKFTEEDIEALFLILKDEDVNKFLPWFCHKNREETKKFLSYSECISSILETILISYIKNIGMSPSIILSRKF